MFGDVNACNHGTSYSRCTNAHTAIPAFSEKSLGHKSFSDFVKAYPKVAEVDESTNIVRIRLAPDKA